MKPIPLCPVCAVPYDKVMHYLPKKANPSIYWFCSKCEHHRKTSIKTANYWLGKGAVTGRIDQDWSPEPLERARAAAEGATNLDDYPGPPRERYCDECERRPLLALYRLGRGDFSLCYGVCEHCGDQGLTHERYARLKMYGLKEVAPPEPATRPDTLQTSILKFVKVPKRRRKS